MKAIIQSGYGPPSGVLALEEVGKPAPKEDEVLIKVQAASVTFGDLAAVPNLALLPCRGSRQKEKSSPGKKC